MVRCNGATSAQPHLENLLKRTDAYFTEVGLLPFILRFPVEGKVDSLKRGLLRSCIQCSQYINDQLRCALDKGALRELGPTKDGTLPYSENNGNSSCMLRSKTRELRRNHDNHGSKSDSTSVSGSSPIMDACLEIQKLRLIAWELGDEALRSQCDPPVLGQQDLNFEYLREVRQARGGEV